MLNKPTQFAVVGLGSRYEEERWLLTRLLVSEYLMLFCLKNSTYGDKTSLGILL
jgi:hypothetical protein